jgi:hypothetical protein
MGSRQAPHFILRVVALLRRRAGAVMAVAGAVLANMAVV